MYLTGSPVSDQKRSGNAVRVDLCVSDYVSVGMSVCVPLYLCVSDYVQCIYKCVCVCSMLVYLCVCVCHCICM